MFEIMIFLANVTITPSVFCILSLPSGAGFTIFNTNYKGEQGNSKQIRCPFLMYLIMEL